MSKSLESPIRDKEGRLKDKEPVQAITLKRREQQAKWYQDNKVKANKRNAEWKRKNSIRRKWHEAKRRYGISFELYKNLMEDDCMICGAKPNGKAHAIDHCHKTEHEEGKIKIRGVLCQACNMGIGFFKHEIHLVRRALKYLHERM